MGLHILYCCAKSTMHTYRICNTHTGQGKTVPRNLLLKANFLTTEVEEFEPSFSDDLLMTVVEEH